jgi:hypothetical protein
MRGGTEQHAISGIHDSLILQQYRYVRVVFDMNAIRLRRRDCRVVKGDGIGGV